jgi:serine/threonine protein phosphatase PrpC
MTQPPNENPATALVWSGHTDRGRVRPNNEDTFLGLQIDAREVRHLGKIGDAPTAGADYVFAVSDGMGGARSGEVASRITVDRITHLFPRAFRQSAAGLTAGFGDVMGQLFAEIHRDIAGLGRAYEECAGMGATLSLCWFTPGWMYFGHIGDSRIYYLPAEGGIRQVSHDDSHVGWLFRTGQINEREAKTHPRRNALSKALGAGNQFVDPQVGAVAFSPGDLCVLCTDGVVDALYDESILQLLRTPEADEAGLTPAHRLVRAGVERSGRDNATAVVVQGGVSL